MISDIGTSADGADRTSTLVEYVLTLSKKLEGLSALTDKTGFLIEVGEVLLGCRLNRFISVVWVTATSIC